MVLSKRVGAILKEARESRKLSIRDVARETNITPKYIESLENEDYSQFPGETYALGFLRSYAEYLNLDTEQVINLYRGLKIDQTQAPVKELTKPTRSLSMPIVLDRRKAALFAGILAALVAIGLVAYGVYEFIPASGGGARSSSADISGDPCHDRQIVPVTMPAAGAPPRTENISGDNLLKFILDTASVELCLVEVDRKSDPAHPRAVFHVRVNDEEGYTFRAAEGEAVTLSSSISGLTDLTRPVRITPQVLGDFAARIQLEGMGGAPGSTASQTMIQVTLQFMGDSYIEWVDDGNSHRGVYISAGQTRTLEAHNRLEIKVGNGGGVRIIREGEEPKMAGPVGRIVKASYRRVPDPLDPGMSKIQENLEIVP